MKQLLSVTGLEVRRAGRRVLHGVNFDLSPDSVTVLLGTNGAGKSTLLRCVLGLLVPDCGGVRVLGQDPLRAGHRVRGTVGYVPDQPDVYAWMTAQDLFRLLRDQVPNWSEERVERLLQCLRVPRDLPFGALSRGEAAKVMLVAALASAPPLVILDEPFARLSPPVREEVLRVFLEEAPASGGAALVATHDLDVAARLADRVLVLDRGRLVADVNVEDLLVSAQDGSGLPEALRRLYPEPERTEMAR